MRSSVLSRPPRCLLLAAIAGHASPPSALSRAVRAASPATALLWPAPAIACLEGSARSDRSEADTAAAKGAGLRHRIARQLGLYTRIDFA